MMGGGRHITPCYRLSGVRIVVRNLRALTISPYKDRHGEDADFNTLRWPCSSRLRSHRPLATSIYVFSHLPWNAILLGATTPYAKQQEQVPCAREQKEPERGVPSGEWA